MLLSYKKRGGLEALLGYLPLRGTHRVLQGHKILRSYFFVEKCVLRSSKLTLSNPKPRSVLVGGRDSLG
ncbi:MAG: hypothetical protein AAFQ87_16865, partial [Bacteroidota bacterium]